MAQNKLEEEFRNKLNLREINPTPAAWDRLNAMLSVAEEKKSKKSYAWMYIAAACIIVLLVGSMFFKQSALEQPTDQIEVVEKQPQKVIIDDTILKVSNDAPVRTQVAVAGQSSAPAQKSKVNPISISNQEAVADNPPQKNIETQYVSTVSNSQIDELLASAMTSTNYNKASVTVDAGSLLSQVDGELELSFREKVIKSAGKNYQNVKVALANRNLE